MTNTTVLLLQFSERAKHCHVTGFFLVLVGSAQGHPAGQLQGIWFRSRRTQAASQYHKQDMNGLCPGISLKLY